ncbi:MAG: hypothetical protein RR313_01790 [Anaerovoracaceae bacterium]
MDNAEQQEVKSKKDAFLEKLKSRYKDDKFEDDESIYGRIAEDYDGMEGKISKYDDESKKLVSLFDKDQRAASFLLAWKDGKNPIEFILENFGDEFKEAVDNPEKKEEFAKAHTAWLTKIAKSKELEKECDDNLQASFKVLEELQSKNGWSDEQAKEIFNSVNNIITDGIYNKISPETFELASKGLSFDSAINEASTEAEIRGKNAKIEEKLASTQAPVAIPPSLNGASRMDEKPKQKRYNPFKVEE